MHASSMRRAILILIVAFVTPFFCLSIGSIGAAPIHSAPHEHHHADPILLASSTAEADCSEAAWLPISKELRVRLVGDVAFWRYPAEACETHVLVDQPLPIPPDTVRALLQIYRL